MIKAIINKLFRKKSFSHIYADEVFLDSKNIPKFNMNQMEGVLEQPLSQSGFQIFTGIVVVIVVVFIIRGGYLQIHQGANYLKKSNNNYLQGTTIFAERGIIYDRNNIELSWNGINPDPTIPYLEREYIDKPGFSHLIGYIGYPTRDSSGNFWRDTIIGKSGIEQIKNTELSGTNGKQLVETNVDGAVLFQNRGESAVPGNNVTLTIDSRIQSRMYEYMREYATNLGFSGGAGVMVNIHTGEILALVSYPEYSNTILSHGDDHETIRSYTTDSKKPMFNRTLSGLYTPGSIVKPYLGIAALNEGLITPNTTVYSSGSIEIKNKYNDNTQIFRDWKKGGHGTVTITTAIAESVNTFFYAIGGGWAGQNGLGITKMGDYFNKFKIAEPVVFELGTTKSGTIPGPNWKKKNFTDGTWRLGDTYNASIGQFGFQVGVLPMVRAVSAIASNGQLINPHITTDSIYASKKPDTISGISNTSFETMKTAMRTTVTAGTGQSMNVPYVTIAAKTGTAQVGANRQFMNSWSTGFFPYDNPEYAFVLVMERGPSTNTSGSSAIMRKVFDSMYTEAPEYFGLAEKTNKPITPLEPTGTQIIGDQEPITLIDSDDSLKYFYEHLLENNAVSGETN